MANQNIQGGGAAVFSPLAKPASQAPLLPGASGIPQAQQSNAVPLPVQPDQVNAGGVAGGGGQVGTASVAHYGGPAAPPPSTVQTSAGYSPDFKSLITNDPTYAGAQNAAQFAQGNASAQRRAQVQQSIIQYGGLPPGFTDTYGDIDQATLDNAKNNQQSTLAQLKTNYGTSQQQFMRALAARGALQSGDLSYGQDQLDKGYAQQQYDAANTEGNTLTGALTGYSGVLGQNAQNLSGAIGSAEQNVLGQTNSQGNPVYAPVASSSANYDAANSARYGQPVYSDGQGNLYDSTGNPLKSLAGSGINQNQYSLSAR